MSANVLDADVARIICGNVDDLKCSLQHGAAKDRDLLERAIAACKMRPGYATKQMMLQRALKKLPAQAATVRDSIFWRYLPELPDDGVRLLLATVNPATDELLVGFHDDNEWHCETHNASFPLPDDFVYAWAHMPSPPAKPAEKGGAK